MPDRDGDHDHMQTASKPPGVVPSWAPTSPLDMVVSVVVLFNFAVAQPILDVLGRNPEFFVANSARTLEIVGLTGLLTVAAPLLLSLPLVGVARVAPAVGTVLHLAMVGALAGLLALQGIRALPGAIGLPGIILVAVALSVGVGAAGAYRRWRLAQRYVRVGLVAPALFGGAFLLVSPASAIVAPSGHLPEGASRVGRPAPIVMVIFDELPVSSLMDAAGDVDELLFPNIARLSRERMTWFRDATTVHVRTAHAVPAITTGRYPQDRDQLPISAHHPDNMFNVLRDHYALANVNEPITALCPHEACGDDADTVADPTFAALLADVGIVFLHIALPGDLARGVPPIEDAWGGFADRGVLADAAGEVASPPVAAADEELVERIEAAKKQEPVEEFRAFVRRIERADRPELHVLHVLFPHSPWRHLPSGQPYFHTLPIPGRDGDRWNDDQWLVTQAYQRHLLQVAAADTLVGELVERLDRRGLFDDALIVLTADHGIAFRPERPLRVFQPDTTADLAAVPLLVKLPGQSHGETVDDPAELIDIWPTVADTLEITPRPEADGRSLFSRPDPARERRLYTSHGRISLTGVGVAEEARSLARDKQATFGEGVDGLYRFGPHAELVGQDVRDLPLAAAPEGWDIVLRHAVEYTRVEPGSSRVPSLVRGVMTVPRPPQEERFLAVAVNGRVAGIARTFDWDGTQASFSTVVPLEAFRRGANDVRAYVIDDGVLLHAAG